MPQITLPMTGVPKRNFIEGAFEEWGVNGYEFERTPQEIAKALRRLNAMMQEWPFSMLGYVGSDYGVGSVDGLSGVDPAYEQAVTLSLAQRLAPAEGAQLSPDTKAVLARSMARLASSVSTIPTAVFMSSPAGAGNKGRASFISD